MKILIVEDEAIAEQRLRRLLLILEPENERFDITHEDQLNTAITRLEYTEFDLLFLDLSLHDKDGFDILKHCVSQSPHTIIVSAYAEKAIEAYEYGVLDFIAKPATADRLEKALHRFFTNSRSDNAVKYLTVRHSGGFELFDIATVIYIKASGQYSEIHFKNQPYQLHYKSLQKLLMILPEHFERIHKSYILNLHFAKRFCAHEGSRYNVELKDGTILPVGRGWYKEIKEKLLSVG